MKTGFPCPSLPVSWRCSNIKAFQSLCVFYQFGGTWLLNFPSPSPQPPPPGSPRSGMGGLFDSGKNLGFRQGSSGCLIRSSPGLSEVQENREEGYMAVRARWRWRTGSWEN